MLEVKPVEIVHHPPMDQLQGFKYCIDSNPSWGEAITLGFQHYILSLGTAVMIPTMLVPLMGGNDCQLSGMQTLRATQGCVSSQEIASYLGLELGKINIIRFATGEIYVQLQESVRSCDVFLVQPTCPPANENLMELLTMIDACRRASAKNIITAVIAYFGYARADRKSQGRGPIAAKLVANMITEASANCVLVRDLHSSQAMGYFDIPVNHVYGQPVILDYLASKNILFK